MSTLDDVDNVQCDPESEDDMPRHYFPGACLVCKAVPSALINLSRCSSCRIAKYCSKKHQRLDWPQHKAFCRQLKTHVEELLPPVQDSSSTGGQHDALNRVDWLRSRASLVLTLRLGLGRELMQHEREMVFFTPVCELCGCFDISCAVECTRCHSAFYCGLEHMDRDADRHSAWCQPLLLALQCDCQETRHGVADPPICPSVDSVYQPLSGTIYSLLNEQILGLGVADDTAVDPLLLAFLSERLTFPLTVLYVLQRCAEVSPLLLPPQQRETLIVHVVGAKMLVECLGIIKWEYLVHRLPRLRSFRLVLIGPELFDGCDQESFDGVDDSGDSRCEDCVQKNRRIIYEMRPCCYHEYCSSENRSTPDLVVCFNAGLHEFADASDPQRDTWRASVSLLAAAGCPLLVTAYTRHELQQDLDRLQDGSTLRPLMELQHNPFGSGRPVRDMCREDDRDVFYMNQYLTVLTSSGDK